MEKVPGYEIMKYKMGGHDLFVVGSGAGEIAAAFLLNNPRLTFWSPAEGYFWAIECACMLLLSGIVTFVTGAARTVMYHDEKR